MEQKREEKEYPFYIKATVVMLGLVLFIYILNALGDVLVPFAFSGLIAILLNPLNTLLERRLPKVVAISLTIFIAILIVVLIFYFLSSQTSMFLQSLPLLKQKMAGLLQQGQQWTETHFGFSLQKQINTLEEALNNGQILLTNTLNTIVGTISVLVLIPIYVFLLLYYKLLILNFLFEVFSEKHSLRVAEILSQTKRAIQSFMIGLLLETAIVCVMNSVALLLIGVPYAIVIGIIGGILNMLPYIGGIIAVALPMLMALIAFNGFTAQIIIVAAYLIIQFIDNNFLVPWIISKKVQINALISIVIVLLGGALWGVSGMFLSIPMIAVLKIIFDRVDELKPWGHLLGDEIPSEHMGVIWQKRWNRIFRRIQKQELEVKEHQHLDK